MAAWVRAVLRERRRRSSTPLPWAPSDFRTNSLREKKLMLTMEICMEILGNSRFYHEFQHLLQTSSVSEHLRKVLGSYSKMQLVIYGIGNFESSKRSAFQLSLAILMQRDFKWIGNIQVFDPVLSVTECRVLEALGCSALCVNEGGRRKVLGPTLFFMPYCQLYLYNNVLQANWYPNLLGKVVIFGNSFNQYKKASNPDILRPIWAAHKFTNELEMRHYCCVSKKPMRHHCSPFREMSWIFFNLEMQITNNLPYNNDGFCRIGRKIDLQVDPGREERLKQEIESCIKDLESSTFYHNFRDKLQTPPISKHLCKVMGSEWKMKMVIIYDYSNIEVSGKSRLHLSLAILMKKHFKWIEDIEVFSAFISATECRVLKSLGCGILSLDEYRRSWQALKPTMFFLPDRYCTKLYNHLLKANWKYNLLSNIVLFGNSLNNEWPMEDSHIDLEYTTRYNGAARSFAKKFGIKTICQDSNCKSYYDAFYYLRWHFFGSVTEAELQFMNEFLQKGCYISY